MSTRSAKKESTKKAKGVRITIPAEVHEVLLDAQYWHSKSTGKKISLGETFTLLLNHSRVAGVPVVTTVYGPRPKSKRKK